jgi:hypothetical protein
LFCLAQKAENQILLSANTCKNNVTCQDLLLSTLHAEKEQQIVEPATDLPLSQCDLLAEPCNKNEFCDTSISSPQLEKKHPLVSFSVPNILQEDGNNTVECIEQFEQLYALPKWEKNDCAAPITLEESEQNNIFGAANSLLEYAYDEL